MKKRIIVFMCLFVTMSFGLFVGCQKKDTASGAKKEKPLIVAMELAYPPFETKDEKGNPSGISVDFSKAFGDYIGREVKIENTAWDGLIPSLQTGKADLIVSSMTITDSRSEIVDFSKPYANSLLAILTNKNSDIYSIEDLNMKGKKIAVKIGSTGYIYAKENLLNAEIISFSDETACVTEVAQGKADAFIYDQLTIYRNNQQNPETTKAIYIPFQNVEYWGAAAKKGNTELITQLNEFIDSYSLDGGFDELTQKYLSEEKIAFDELGFQWFFY